MKTLSLIVILSMAMLQIGCTRGAQDAKLKLKIPNNLSKASNGAFNATAEQLGHVVVNVSGPGMGKKIVWHWDRECGDGCVNPSPQFVELTVPTTSNPRLIQFLGVYFNPDNERKTFSYGDKLVPGFSPGFMDVTISLADFGQGNVEGNISGQYVTGTVNIAGSDYGVGPTGGYSIDFTPPSNPDHPMTVGYGEMFNGWMSALAISGVPLSYNQLLTGITYPGLNYEAMKTYINNNNPANISLLSTPEEFWVQESGGNERWSSHGGESVVGFFGPQAAAINVSGIGAQLCYDQSSGPISNIWDDEFAGTNVNWSPSGFASGAISRVAGGAPSCSATNYYSNKLYIDPTKSFKNGNRGVLGFRGPFREVSSATFSLPACSGISGPFHSLSAGCSDPTSAQAEVHWAYINNLVFAGANSIDGVSVFVKPKPSCNNGCDDHNEPYEDKNIDEGIKCSQLQSFGFQHVGDYGANQTSAVFPFIKANDDRLSGYVCPYQNTAMGRYYYKSAARIEDYGNGGGNQNGLGPLTIHKVYTNFDNDGDQYIVGSGSGIDLHVDWSEASGASSYAVVVKDNSDSVVCSSITTTASFVTFPMCFISESANQYKVEIKALDAADVVLETTNAPFYRIEMPPTINTSSFNSCGTHGAGPYKTLLFDVTGFDIGTYSIKTDWGGGTNQNASIAPAATISLNTGMDDTGTDYTGVVEVKGCHASGYCSPTHYYDLVINSGGTCPIVPRNNFHIESHMASGDLGDIIEISVDFTGDMDGDATLAIKWCNQTDSGPSCDPHSGNTAPLSRQNGFFNGHIPVVAGDDPGDVLKYTVVVSETGSVIGDPINDTVTLDSKPEIMLAPLNLSTANANEFTATLNYHQDVNNNASAQLYWCNESDNQNCDPIAENGPFQMDENTVSPKYFNLNINGLSDPENLYDYIKVLIIITDPDVPHEMQSSDSVSIGSV